MNQVKELEQGNQVLLILKDDGNDIISLKNHPFFKDIDFEKIPTMASPFKVNYINSPNSGFDSLEKSSIINIKESFLDINQENQEYTDLKLDFNYFKIDKFKPLDLIEESEGNIIKAKKSADSDTISPTHEKKKIQICNSILFEGD